MKRQFEKTVVTETGDPNVRPNSRWSLSQSRERVKGTERQRERQAEKDGNICTLSIEAKNTPPPPPPAAASAATVQPTARR